ncbi:MAG: hypothetical protein ACOYMB_05120 [Patescibacteria group bacterium]
MPNIVLSRETEKVTNVVSDDEIRKPYNQWSLEDSLNNIIDSLRIKLAECEEGKTLDATSSQPEPVKVVTATQPKKKNTEGSKKQKIKQPVKKVVTKEGQEGDVKATQDLPELSSVSSVGNSDKPVTNDSEDGTFKPKKPEAKKASSGKGTVSGTLYGPGTKDHLYGYGSKDK